ncbi:MAG TPA: Rieske 2Fe-2S domain-containing protein [Chthoniobacterales bacterium]
MDKVGDLVNRQAWLAPVETVLGATADTLFNNALPFAQKVRNFFHGTWLGHPLHPVVTDVPVGAWTVAALLDSYELASGDETYAPGADIAIEIGLLAAMVAALSGLNDWNATSGKPKRVGSLHALINIIATLCYAGSWWQRRYGCRRAGLTSSLAGYAFAAAGAYFGGHLVYNQRIGVNHAPGELPENFVPVMKESELRENMLRKGEADGIPVVVVKRGGRIFVLAEKCSHLGGPLAEGKLDRETIQCPWHGSIFAIEDGRVVAGPATYSQPCFEVRVREGQIEVRRPKGTAPNPY